MDKFVTERRTWYICFKKRYPVDFHKVKLIYHRFNFVLSITKREVEFHKVAEIQSVRTLKQRKLKTPLFH